MMSILVRAFAKRSAPRYGLAGIVEQVVRQVNVGSPVAALAGIEALSRKFDKLSCEKSRHSAHILGDCSFLLRGGK